LQEPPELKQRARELRKQGVLSEVLLWNQLKYRKMRGYQFMRQKPIGNYIVDFYCSKPRTLAKYFFTPSKRRGILGAG
jgi:very-short-patch-repair endonuclease